MSTKDDQKWRHRANRQQLAAQEARGVIAYQHVVHARDDGLSPVGKVVWTMLCGTQCAVLDDASVHPFTDFYLEKNWDKATCPGCRAEGQRRAWLGRTR